MSQFSPILPTTISYRGQELRLDQPLVMGILNLTPDSFFDGGKYGSSEEAAIQRVQAMVSEGATIIDIGAASSRPGAELVNPLEEQARLLPFFDRIRLNFPDIWISIDTYHSSTAEICLEKGANMINDISAGNIDQKIFEVAGKYKCPYILMHMQGVPGNMQQTPQYTDITSEIISFFRDKIASLNQHGITEIILDPGFGFGKDLEHNFEILRNLNVMKKILGLPLLAGISRKSMVNRVIGTSPGEALNGTTALHILALMNGASILRVHDVKEACQTISLYNKYKSVD